MSLRRLFSCVCPTIIFCSLGFIHVFAADAAADNAMQSIRAESIRAEMRFLSDDLLEGRGTGTRGYDMAAKFMATQVESLGLKPGADNGIFLRTIPYRSMHADSSRSTVTLIRGGKAGAYCLVGSEFFGVNFRTTNSSIRLSAPVVPIPMAAFSKVNRTLLRSSAG